MADRDDLAPLAAALRRGDRRSALRVCVELWGAQRTALLGELAEELGHQATSAHVARADLSSWLKAARGASPEDRTPYLLQLGERSWRDTLAQLEVIAGWSPDPRTARALLRIFRTQRFRSGPSKPLWSALFGELVRLADAPVREALDTSAGVYARGFPTPEMRSWMRQALQGCQSALQERASSAERSWPAAEGRALLVQAKALRDPGDLGSLEAAVFSAPKCDELRQIYADALSERGDPRGEFITLQLLERPNKDQRARAKALLREHGTTWLGPLARALYTGSVVYRRGFLAEAMLDAKAQDLVAVREEPMWRTVESLSIAGSGTSAALLLDTSLFIGLQRLERLDGSLAGPLLERDQPWALEALHLWGSYDTHAEEREARHFTEALCAGKAAENVSEVGLIFSTSPPAWQDQWSRALLREEVSGRLGTLVISSDSQSRVTHEAWLEGSVARDVPIPEQRFCDSQGGYRHRSGWRYALSREDHGRYRLVAEYVHRKGKGAFFARLAELLGKLEGAPLVALTVKAPRYTLEDGEARALRSALRGFAWEREPTLPKGV